MALHIAVARPVSSLNLLDAQQVMRSRWNQFDVCYRFFPIGMFLRTAPFIWQISCQNYGWPLRPRTDGADTA